MKKLFLLMAIASVAIVSCKKDDNNLPGDKVFKGPVQNFQHGKAFTWYEVDNNNRPFRLAIAIDDAAMNSLDTSSAETGGHHHNNMLSLKFHPKVAATAFKFAGLDWNPHGHEPTFIYGLPHFDFHFYMMDEAEVMAIPAYEADSTKFLNWPAAHYFPATYFNPGGGVPQMGVHWLDGTSPELNGQQFTETFIYGSYNGKVTFYEPMITKAFIDANGSFERDIPQPQKYQQSGYFPTRERIVKANGLTHIILEGFVYRTQS